LAIPSILLIHPPISKPCEPPPGLARLAFALRTHGVSCRIYDASLDGLLALLARPLAADDTWTHRALSHHQTNLDALRTQKLYTHRDRYKRAVVDTNRILTVAGRPHDATISLANYISPSLSPVRSADLIRAAEQFEANPFYPIFAHQLLARFQQNAPHIVGLSINFMSQALCAFAMIGFIRRHLPSAKVVCGGGLVSSWMHIPGMGNPFEGLVDDLISGPGERRLIEMCTGLKGIESTITGYDYSDLSMDRYLAPKRVMPYSTSAGCYWKKCAFCPEKAEDAPYLNAAPQAISDDLGRTLAQTAAGLIHFLDNALSPRLMHYLIDHPPGCPWYGFVRVTPQLTDPDFVRGLRASGCVMLKLGVESGDQAVLDALSKGIDVTMVSKALSAIHTAGIATYVYLLFGTPPENAASAMKTLEFTERHADCIDFLNPAIFNLPAHSREAAELETVDFYAGDLSLYQAFTHPQGWTRDRVRRFLSMKFKKSGAIKTILNNDPPFFTSNHAPFFKLAGKCNTT
jgi:hypothetical protein